MLSLKTIAAGKHFTLSYSYLSPSLSLSLFLSLSLSQKVNKKYTITDTAWLLSWDGAKFDQIDIISDCNPTQCLRSTRARPLCTLKFPFRSFRAELVSDKLLTETSRSTRDTTARYPPIPIKKFCHVMLSRLTSCAVWRIDGYIHIRSDISMQPNKYVSGIFYRANFQFRDTITVIYQQYI